MLFNFGQTLAELDVLDGYEAGHDVEQRLPVRLMCGFSNYTLTVSGLESRTD